MAIKNQLNLPDVKYEISNPNNFEYKSISSKLNSYFIPTDDFASNTEVIKMSNDEDTAIDPEPSKVNYVNYSSDKISANNTSVVPKTEYSIPNSEKLKQFNSHYDAVESEIPEAKNYRNFLTKIAQAESGFNPTIQNRAGAPAYGYFQFMQGKTKTGSYNNIKNFSGLSIDDFKNNPQAQIKAAIKLAQSFEKGFSSSDLELAKQSGYSNNSLLAGAWLGGNKGVTKYLKGLGDASDRHWSKEGKGTSVGTRMKEFNFKLGGKFQKGGYIIKPGDNLKQIAIDNNVKYDYLLSQNPQISDPSKIKSGDEIKLYGESKSNGNIIQRILGLENDNDILPNGYTRKEYADWQNKGLIKIMEQTNSVVKPVGYTPNYEFIVKHEGFRSNVYNDGKGYKTIGHGLRDKEALAKGKITKDESIKYVKRHVDNEVLKYLNKEPYWNSLNNNQKDAITSLVYNIGWSKFKNESPNLQKALLNKDWNNVIKNMDHGINDKGFGGLRKRRLDEQELFAR